MKSKRIVFTFDERALQAASALQSEKGHRTLAETVRESISIMAAIESQSSQGFRELSVRNPTTGRERLIVR